MTLSSRRRKTPRRGKGRSRSNPERVGEWITRSLRARNPKARTEGTAGTTRASKSELRHQVRHFAVPVVLAVLDVLARRFLPRRLLGRFVNESSWRKLLSPRPSARFQESAQTARRSFSRSGIQNLALPSSGFYRPRDFLPTVASRQFAAGIGRSRAKPPAPITTFVTTLKR